MKLSWPNLTFPPVNLRSLTPTLKMIQHNTIDEIVDDLILKIDQKDIDYLLNPPPTHTSSVPTTQN